MDDLFKTYFSSLFLSLALLVSLTGRAFELEYISPERSTALANQFDNATLTENQQSLLSQKKAWTCSMYGVRTRLQVQKAVKLYSWTSPSQGQWQNGGTHPVAKYVYQGKLLALVGQTDQLQDEVRLTNRGQLVSRLSSRTAKSDVLAYTVCDAI